LLDINEVLIENISTIKALLETTKSKGLNKNHPKVVLAFLGGPGRNRTTDTRIFKYPPIDRFVYEINWLRHP